jgi:hypothetical protein
MLSWKVWASLTKLIMNETRTWPDRKASIRNLSYAPPNDTMRFLLKFTHLQHVTKDGNTT